MQRIHALFAFDPAIDPARFAGHCREWGINTPILHRGFFQDDRMTRALEKESLAPWLNIPVFFDQAYLESHPDAYAITSRGRKAVHEWLHFVCPSHDRYLDDLVQKLRDTIPRARPSIVSLDFIRHYVFWEAVDLAGSSAAIEDGCYCPRCLSRFEAFARARVDRADPVAQLRSTFRQQWSTWKCQRVADVAERLLVEIRYLCDDASLAIKTVPWRDSDLDGAIRWSAGQDIPRLARNVDIVSPMAFTHILGQTPRWKQSVLRAVRNATGKPILSYLQVAKVYRDVEISPAQFEAELSEASSNEWAGLAVFHYDQLTAAPEKAKILGARLR